MVAPIGAEPQSQSAVRCSTIIPTVGRSTLERAVISALDQHLAAGSHEVIVVNDSGRALDAAAWHSHPAVTVVHTNRCERSVARNVGAAIARGVYLHFLDDDDYLLPHGLAALLEIAETSGCPLVSGGVRLVDVDGNLLRHLVPWCRANMFGEFLTGAVLQLSHSIMSREAFIRAGGFDPSICYGEDGDLEIRLALHGACAATPHEVACVRVSGASGSTVDPSRRTDLVSVREKALNLSGAFERLRDSVHSSPWLRHRACRALLGSALRNLRDGRWAVAASRLGCAARLAGVHPLQPAFWRRPLTKSDGPQLNDNRRSR